MPEKDTNGYHVLEQLREELAESETTHNVRDGYLRVSDMIDQKTLNIINCGSWDCPENAIKALMQRVAAGQDIFDHGEIIGKAITVQQPYASFIAVGEKLIETRSWSTKYRGTVFIHSGKRLASIPGSPEETFTQILLRGSFHLSDTPLNNLPRGALIGCGTLVDCVLMDEAFCARMENTREWQLGWYSPGRYAWKFEDMQPLPEIVPMQGQLSLWDVRV